MFSVFESVFGFLREPNKLITFFNLVFITKHLNKLTVNSEILDIYSFT